MTGLTLTLLFIGRLLLGAAFVVFGIRNINNIPRLSGVLEAKKLPQPRQIIMLGIGIQIVGGALVALGFLSALGAIALIAFLMLAVYWFHPFWEFSGAERTPHENAWIMNTGLSGAFLMVAAMSF